MKKSTPAQTEYISHECWLMIGMKAITERRVTLTIIT